MSSNNDVINILNILPPRNHGKKFLKNESDLLWRNRLLCAPDFSTFLRRSVLA